MNSINTPTLGVFNTIISLTDINEAIQDTIYNLESLHNVAETPTLENAIQRGINGLSDACFQIECLKALYRMNNVQLPVYVVSIGEHKPEGNE